MDNLKAVYDAEYMVNQASLDAMAASNDGETYYTFQYILAATLGMYQATLDVTYLERALTWAETMIAHATIVDYFNRLNWSGTYASVHAPVPIAYQLEDYQGSTELARLGAIIKVDAGLNAVYGARADVVLLFVKNNIVEKWLTDYNSLAWVNTQIADYGHLLNDKVVLLMSILSNLKIAGDNSYNVLLTNCANSLAARFQAYTGDSIVWDLGLFWNAPSPSDALTIDTSHGNRYPAAIMDCIAAGIIFDASYILGLSNLLKNIIWDGVILSPQFTNFVDGTNAIFPADSGDRPPWGNGLIYSGWVRLGEGNADVRAISNYILKAIMKGTSNPSLDYMNNVYGKMSLAGHMAKNLRLN
jgi:hypothetical protein